MFDEVDAGLGRRGRHEADQTLLFRVFSCSRTKPPEIICVQRQWRKHEGEAVITADVIYSTSMHLADFLSEATYNRGA